MPNWVKNIITAKAETINKIKEKYFENDVLSFQKVNFLMKFLTNYFLLLIYLFLHLFSLLYHQEFLPLTLNYYYFQLNPKKHF